MDSIINSKNLKEHSVEQYRFKVLGGASAMTVENEKEDNSILNLVKEEVNIIKSNEAPVKKDESNKFIEQLLKKSDDLSTTIIELQMKRDKQEIDFQNRLKNEIKREAEDAFEKGYQKAKNKFSEAVQNIKLHYASSINTLEEEHKKVDEYLKKIENELTKIAVEIAKEVILKEVKQSSSEIAVALSNKLVDELRDAKNIELKVNPKDFQALVQEYSKIEHIKVSSDKAVTEGGVMVLSEIGNLDGNLSTRIEKVKNLIENN
jgi:flagellar assembly protein FliH